MVGSAFLGRDNMGAEGNSNKPSWWTGGGYLDWLPPGQRGAAVGATVGAVGGGFVIPIVGGFVGAPAGSIVGGYVANKYFTVYPEKQ